MAAYRELNLIAKATVGRCPHQPRVWRILQLFKQVGLIEPRHIQLTRIIGNCGYRARASAFGGSTFYLPDQTLGRGHFVKRQIGDLFELAIVAMVTRKIKEKIGHCAYTKAAQPCSCCWTYFS